MPIEEDVPRPVRWSEPAHFGRAMALNRSEETGLFSLRLGRFASTSLVFLIGRGLVGFAFGGRRPFDFDLLDVAAAASVGVAVAFLLPGVFRRVRGHVRVDRTGIVVMRPAALPTAFFLRSRFGKLADPAGSYLVLGWTAIESIGAAVQTIEGRVYEVLVVQSKDGQTHPIARGRGADLDGVFALAEAAGPINTAVSTRDG